MSLGISSNLHGRLESALGDSSARNELANPIRNLPADSATVAHTSKVAEINAKVAGQPASVSFAAAAGATSVCQLTLTIKDANGVAVTAPTNFDLTLSDNADGHGLTATSASGTVVAGASGADIGDYTSKKAKRVQCTAAGLYILAITDTAKTGFYPVVTIDGLKAIVGPQLLTANYG